MRTQNGLLALFTVGPITQILEQLRVSARQLPVALVRLILSTGADAIFVMAVWLFMGCLWSNIMGEMIAPCQLRVYTRQLPVALAR